MLCHVAKIRNGSAPDYLGEHFVPLNRVHDRITRSSVTAVPNPETNGDFTFRDNGRYAKPKVRGFGDKSFSAKGVQLWNNLPQSLRDIPRHHQGLRTISSLPCLDFEWNSWIHYSK